MTLEQFRGICVWLMMATSFFVIKEPAPCDLLFILNFILFIATGLRIPIMALPIVMSMLLYNLGGVTSLLSVVDEDKDTMYVLTTAYMSAASIFFASYVAENPTVRMRYFSNGYVVAAVIASLVGVMAYFDIAGLGFLTREERVTGTFKDPNVLSTFLIFPALRLVQSFILDERGYVVRRLFALLVIVAALFLAFSRGAWISFIGSTFLMICFTFVMTPSKPLRTRIVLMTVVGIILASILLIGLLSVPTIQNLFFDRLTLVKSYDAGENGRFGNQLNSIPYLLTHPFGYGPALFGHNFGEDPHNSYINAFASYGWLGGFVYISMMVSTVIVGFRAMLTRTPWQNWAIVVYFPMLTTVLQGVQIDTDHWRHLYWLIGMTWGLAAASLGYRQDQTQLSQDLSGLHDQSDQRRERPYVPVIGF